MRGEPAKVAPRDQRERVDCGVHRSSEQVRGWQSDL